MDVISEEQAERLNPQQYEFSLKIDGCMGTYSNGRLLTKRTDRTLRFPQIVRELELLKDCVLIGEISISETSKVFDVSASTGWKDARFYLFDALKVGETNLANKPYSVRKEAVMKILQENNFKHITTPKTFATFREGWDYVIKNGCEGLVIRSKLADQTYKCKKLTEEKLLIIRHETGSEKGAFILNRNGKEVKVSGTSALFVSQYYGFLKEEKKVMAEIEYAFETTSGSLFQPRLRKVFID